MVSDLSTIVTTSTKTVLILVVMEYGLRRISLAECSDYEVLILVVMEYGLRLSMYVVMPVGIVES